MIPVNEPLLNGNEKKYLNECIDTGWIGSDGKFVSQFEEGMAKYIGRKYAISLTNGTAALELAIESLGITKGDEVIMPSFTIISCAQAIVKTGATPVLVDSHFDTFNMKVDEIESKITKHTKAIMIVHIFGLPVDIDPILNIAKKYNLKIIEDSAQMHGQTYKNKMCGSFGDVSTFSFYPNKQITTGEGGMLLTNDETIYQNAKSLKNLCFSADPNKRFIHERLGWNLRMSNLQAAVGVAQLEKIEEIVAKKRWIGETYQKLLSNIDSINLPIPSQEYAKNIYWVFAITLKDNVNKNAMEIMDLLNKKGIGTRPFFYPIHKQPVFNSMGLFHKEEYPNATKLYDRGFYVPSGLGINELQIKEVVKSLKEIL